MTATGDQHSRNNNEQLRLMGDDNLALGHHVEPLKMFVQPTTLSNSSSPTQIASSSEGVLSEFLSQLPTRMADRPVSSSSSPTVYVLLSQRHEDFLKDLKERTDQELAERKVHERLEQTGLFNPDLTSSDNEHEHHHEVTVRIYTYGNPEKTLMEVLREVGRNLNHGFPGNFEMEWNGQTVVYDAKAHDGEHVGHNETLTFVRPVAVLHPSE